MSWTQDILNMNSRFIIIINQKYENTLSNSPLKEIHIVLCIAKTEIVRWFSRNNLWIIVNLAIFRTSFNPYLLLVVCSVCRVYQSVVVVCCYTVGVGCRVLTNNCYNCQVSLLVGAVGSWWSGVGCRFWCYLSHFFSIVSGFTIPPPPTPLSHLPSSVSKKAKQHRPSEIHFSASLVVAILPFSTFQLESGDWLSAYLLSPLQGKREGENEGEGGSKDNWKD